MRAFHFRNPSGGQHTMRNRGFRQFPASDDKEDEQHPRKRVTRPSKNPAESEAKSRNKRRKPVKPVDDDDEDEDGYGGEPEADQEGGREEKSAKNAKRKRDQEEEEEEEEEQAYEDAKAVGFTDRFSGEGSGRRRHYLAFEYHGDYYKLEDIVLVNPAETDHKPYVAIIKDIARTENESMMVTAQWFYRPEEAEIKGGGSWQLHDDRELFYSFHQDEVPAESVMHKCRVHFIPIPKQLPDRKQNPGFIVQKVYDTFEKKLWELTDKDYEDNKQHEVDILIQKAFQCLGDLPDIDTKDTNAD